MNMKGLILLYFVQINGHVQIQSEVAFATMLPPAAFIIIITTN